MPVLLELVFFQDSLGRRGSPGGGQVDVLDPTHGEHRGQRRLFEEQNFGALPLIYKPTLRCMRAVTRLLLCGVYTSYGNLPTQSQGVVFSAGSWHNQRYQC